MIAIVRWANLVVAEMILRFALDCYYQKQNLYSWISSFTSAVEAEEFDLDFAEIGDVE